MHPGPPTLSAPPPPARLCRAPQVLEKLDTEGCLHVARMLRSLPGSKTVLVVGQANSYVTNAFETVDVVVKRGGRATIELAP